MTVAESQELMVAYRTDNSLEANALAAHLADAGIDAHVAGDFPYGAYPGLHFEFLPQVEVWIPTHQRDAAAPLLSTWLETHRRPTQSRARFQYSVGAILMLMTLVALYTAAYTANEPARTVALVALQVAIGLAFFGVLVRRYLRERAAPTDHDEPNHN